MTQKGMYVGSCCIDNGGGSVIAGIGVYWAPALPYNLRKSTRNLPATCLGIKSVELRTCNQCTKQTIRKWKRDNFKASANDSEQIRAQAMRC